MEGDRTLKQVAITLAVLHPIEAVIARRMAKKRGRNPNLYFFLTLVFGVFALLKLRRIEPVEQ